MFRLAQTALLVAASVAGMAASSAAQDGNPHKITSLPGYDDPKPINFDQYAGHIELPSNRQKMFYWLVESESNPASDPLVLWLNGGPGCSSLGGFFTELGPFVVESDLSVKRNPYAWNRKANIVFLESPAGVGFSQPVLNVSNYNDDFTTDRAYEFLAQFLATYPAYKGRDFYVTGESYAGVYVPYLVYKLVKEPIAQLNLKGYAIGNPFTDNIVDASAYMDYFYSHGLISIEMFNQGKEACGPRGVANCFYGGDVCPDACLKVIAEAISSSEWENAQALNQYYLYGDVCKLNNSQGQTLTNYNIRPLTHRGKYGPCNDKFTELYLRSPAVQAAIHAPNVTWSDCSDKVSGHYTRAPSSLQKYPTILKAGLKGLIYSGDADSNVNFLGTERWLTKEGLNLTVVEPWKAWFGPDKQLSGYSTKYTNVTFTTIKGAGHLVPATRPLHALYLFECFIYGQAACSGFDYPKDPLEYLSGADLTAPVLDESETTPVSYLWWTLGGVIVVVLVFFGWRFYAAQQSNKVQYTELTSEAKPVYTQ
ncbi:hypothetical protein AC1031_020796 [Aphanomyces cochlioides]|nr:hypothetical protein AC1031_020796 [Aphanomyces cochlioides]